MEIVRTDEEIDLQMEIGQCIIDDEDLSIDDFGVQQALTVMATIMWLSGDWDEAPFNTDGLECEDCGEIHG